MGNVRRFIFRDRMAYTMMKKTTKMFLLNIATSVTNSEKHSFYGVNT